MRIAIIGSTGSGKSTLAGQLSQHYNIPHIELDYYHFEPDWKEVPDEVFRQRIGELTDAESWITDGNYSVLRDIIWHKADVIIWLNYPFTFTFWRLFKRTMSRVFTQKTLWHGNRETFTNTFASKNSILYWFLLNYSKLRKRYPALFKQEEYKHLTIIELNKPDKALEQVILRLKN